VGVFIKEYHRTKVSFLTAFLYLAHFLSVATIRKTNNSSGDHKKNYLDTNIAGTVELDLFLLSFVQLLFPR